MHKVTVILIVKLWYHNQTVTEINNLTYYTFHLHTLIESLNGNLYLQKLVYYKFSFNSYLRYANYSRLDK